MSTAPQLSVVVPVSDNVETLCRALVAILASQLPRESYELIVVDDASSDGSPQMAARYADTVIRLNGRKCGTAYARNRGAEVARGDLLAFVDADVLVNPDTLPRMMRELAESPDVDAVTASHDQPQASDKWLAQYWKLLHRFGEQSQGTSANVASPCCVIRKDAFMSVGMYDEWRFLTSPLEGVELGSRLKRSGRAAILYREAAANPVRDWNVFSLATEVWKRSALLARSLGYQNTRRVIPGEIVFTLSRPAAPVFALLCGVALTAAIVPQPSALTKAILLLLGAAAINASAGAYFARERGWLFMLSLAPVHLLMQCVSGLGLCVGWILRDAIGDSEPDAATQAYAEVGVETWPPVPRASGR